MLFYYICLIHPSLQGLFLTLVSNLFVSLPNVCYSPIWWALQKGHVEEDRHSGRTLSGYSQFTVRNLLHPYLSNQQYLDMFNTSLIHLPICILLHAIVSHIWIRKHYQIHIHQVYVTLLIYHFNNSTHTQKKQN